MSLEKAEITWSNQEIWRMVLDGRIDLDHIVQRGAAWDRNRQARLIESQILGYPIPSVFAKKTIDEQGRPVYSIMDGKQRILSIKRFLNNEFAMTQLSPVSYFDLDTGIQQTIDMTGKRFKSLPESLKNLLRTMQIRVVYFDNLTQDEERELFRRLNAGLPLSAKSKALAECNDLEEIMEIGNHNLFNTILSEHARGNKNQVVILMKMHTMITENPDNISFDSRRINNRIVKVNLGDDDREALLLILDAFDSILDHLYANRRNIVARKISTETNLISITPFVFKGIRSGKTIEQISSWLEAFYGIKGVASISQEYNTTILSGTTKRTSVSIRHHELEKHYNEYFGEEATL